MQVHVHGQHAPWRDAALLAAIQRGELHPETPVSFDAGCSWLPARIAAQRLQWRGDDGIALVLPTRTESWSTLAGYVALFSLLFFGGPLSVMAGALGFDGASAPHFRLAFPLVVLVLGPLPLALFSLLGLRAIRRDPTYRGKGRAIFALICAAVMAAACLVGLGAALVVR
jgi:hypothetical protein